MIVIIMIGGDVTEIENQFLNQNIPYVVGFEVLTEESLGSMLTQADFESNKILEVFDSLSSLQSKEIYVELLANRLAPQFRCKSYKELSFSEDYFDRTCYEITNHESFVDCGAFNGDTIRNFLNNVDDFNNIYSFEMDIENYRNLLSYVDTLNDKQKEKINCYHAGVWNEKSVINYGNEEKSSKDSFSILKTGNCNQVVVDKLDNMINDKPITFIKMDIEGAELKALMGAEKIIKEQKPKLAICIYHKLEDFWEIPIYIKSIVPDYNFEVRHHNDTYWGTVLYAYI